MSQPLERAAIEPAYPALADESDSAGRSSSPLLKVGGGLGVAACVIGLVLLMAGCAGYGKALTLGVVVIVLAAAGLAVSFVGAIAQKDRIAQDTHILQALFVNFIGLVGGALEAAVAFDWKIFYR